MKLLLLTDKQGVKKNKHIAFYSGMLVFLYMGIICNTIEIKIACFMQLESTKTNKVMVLYQKPQKWGSIA